METIITVLLQLFLTPANAFTQEIFNIEATIETQVRTNVIWSNGHDFCLQKQGLYGAYIPHADFIIVCQENHNHDYEELVGTLKHEGWHAVQVKCNNYRAALSDDQIRPHLKDRDRKNLHSYHPKQTRAEAEARVVEQIPTDAWIRGVKAYCR